jgi:UDP-N-acetylglucosamine--N-acetylmuramyl-(pentapeptide) pyrophosphoryl-undecaprenol N-acetylglucosamine transferase
MTIVLCGGGSGGHITPLLAVAHELKSRDSSIRLIYIGEKGGKFAHITESSRLFDAHHYISAGKLRRYHGESAVKRLFDIKTNFLNFRDSFRIMAGIVQAYFLLKKIKADAMLLKGGFVCVPVAIAGHRHNIPYITHDSDALPGLSNRFAARWARYHATAQPAQYYSYPEASVRVVGVPTDPRFRPYSPGETAILREKFGVPATALVILVTGGSNGARRLNEPIISLLPELIARYPNIYVLHQIGAGNQDQADQLPVDLQPHVQFFDFSDELFHMSAIADLIITRAGATTMADFSAQEKACIVVPNPYLTGGHQLKNAEVYADAQAAVIVQESELDKGALQAAVQSLLDDAEARQRIGHNLRALIPEKSAAAGLSDLLQEIAK